MSFGFFFYLHASCSQPGLYANINIILILSNFTVCGVDGQHALPSIGSHVSILLLRVVCGTGMSMCSAHGHCTQKGVG